MFREKRMIQNDDADVAYRSLKWIAMKGGDIERASLLSAVWMIQVIKAFSGLYGCEYAVRGRYWGIARMTVGLSN